VAIVAVALTAWAWLETAHLYGTVRRKVLQRTVRYGLTTAQRWRVVLAAACLTGAAVGFTIAGSVGWAMLALAAFVIARAALPPAALVLAASAGDPSIVRVVARALFPMRVVHLLEGERRSSVRPRGGTSWREVVDWFMETVPMIVVDTRFDTEAVMAEMGRLLHPQIAEKSLFVTHGDGRAPALDRGTGGTPPPRLRQMAREELALAVHRFRARPRKRQESGLER
jgi:hypothetical protein